MKLSKLAEALQEGWHAFRVTLSAKPQAINTTYYANYEPKGDLQKGDIWITVPDGFMYVWTGRRWKGINQNAGS